VWMWVELGLGGCRVFCQNIFMLLTAEIRDVDALHQPNVLRLTLQSVQWCSTAWLMFEEPPVHQLLWASVLAGQHVTLNDGVAGHITILYTHCGRHY